MNTRPFLSTDLETINDWRKRYKLAPIDHNGLPEVGLIVDGIAAGFLLRTEIRTFAMLEGYVSNAEVDRTKKYEAIAVITTELLDIAKQHGATDVGFITRFQGLSDLAKKLGFKGAGEFEALGRKL